MIKIYDFKEVSEEEILKRESVTLNVEDTVSDIIYNVRKNTEVQKDGRKHKSSKEQASGKEMHEQ